MIHATKHFLSMMQLLEGSISNIDKIVNFFNDSRVAQWKRAGPITQRSVDRNYALLEIFFLFFPPDNFNVFSFICEVPSFNEDLDTDH